MIKNIVTQAWTAGSAGTAARNVLYMENISCGLTLRKSIKFYLGTCPLKEAPSDKLQATSCKRQASSTKRRKPQATSIKRQATSVLRLESVLNK